MSRGGKKEEALADGMGNNIGAVRVTTEGLREIFVNLQVTGTMVMIQKVDIPPTPAFRLWEQLKEGSLADKETRDFLRHIFGGSKVTEKEMGRIGCGAVFSREGRQPFNCVNLWRMFEVPITKSNLMGSLSPHFSMVPLLCSHLSQGLPHETQCLHRSSPAVASDERLHREESIHTDNHLEIPDKWPKPTHQGLNGNGVTGAGLLDQWGTDNLSDRKMAKDAGLGQWWMQEHGRKTR